MSKSHDTNIKNLPCIRLGLKSINHYLIVNLQLQLLTNRLKIHLLLEITNSSDRALKNMQVINYYSVIE